MANKFKKIHAPYGAVTLLSNELGYRRDAVRRALDGDFTEHSKCYQRAMEVREAYKKYY